MVQLLGTAVKKSALFFTVVWEAGLYVDLLVAVVWSRADRHKLRECTHCVALLQ